MTHRKNSPRRLLLASSLRCTAMGAGMLTTLLLATGCTAASNQESVMDVIEQRDVVVSFVVDTTEQLTAGNWEANTGTASPQGCTMDNGEEGAAYTFKLWSTERSDDPDSDVQLVVDYWESLGTSTRVTDHGGNPVVYGTGGPVLRASFNTASGEFYRIGAVAPCTPGDATQLKREAKEGRRNGERFPGDEYVPEENVNEEYK